MSSAIAFNLVPSKILSFGKELMTSMQMGQMLRKGAFIEKSIDPHQPEQLAQADMGRTFFRIVVEI